MLEVVGAGLGRTGTYSLKTALTRLGYGPCHHMTSVGESLTVLEGWERVLRGEPVSWDQVLRGFRSAVDWPVCSYWRELAAAYPGAKVILTVRSADGWYASVRQTLFKSSRPAPPNLEGLLMRLEDRLDPGLRRRRQISRAVIWNGTFQGHFEDREYAMEIFRRHNEQVQAGVPADRLLVFDTADGWEPLCAFLGVPVPDEPFPHVNQAAAFRGGLARRRRRILTGRGQTGSSGDAVR